MSTPLLPAENQNRSMLGRLRGFGRSVTAAHGSLQDLGLARRAQLLNVITLLLTLAFAFGLASQPRSVVLVYSLLSVSIVSFLFGKSKYPRVGILLFSLGFISITYLSLFLGLASGFLTSVLAVVPISLIVASAITGPRTFAVLAIYATALTALASYYSKVPILENNIAEASGIIFSTGAVLFGVIVFRARLEKSRLEETRAINQELQEIKTNLEKHVDDRTRELGTANQQIQERAMRLQIISDISQEISTNIEQQPAELLARIVRSISEKLGFYHVGIFLLDENREYAVLRAANSEGGQRMLERHHQLKVGGTGIVGYVSQAAHPRIALDTGSDAVFFNNPNLPKTRSEIAIPIKYGSAVIGVLDAQSTLPSAFKDEDVNILETLANQIAIVVNIGNAGNNAKNASLKAGRFTHSKAKQDGFHYLPDGTISTNLPSNSPLLEKALASGETEVTAQPSTGNPATLAVPVKFRGQVIGVIHIQAAEEKRKWTEDEIIMVQSISDRAAFALENARLFEETTRRAEQEETIARVTTQIGASTNFDHILQTTIHELGLALGVSRSFIQLGTTPDEEPSTQTNPNGHK
ncbi:MAG: GAF domain-containing protein [Chloroflexi bacterium]|nr:GAF domain-containing protein [Chloroflexota bacterium]